jgi:hypothetical protein
MYRINCSELIKIDILRERIYKPFIYIHWLNPLLFKCKSI